MEPSTPMQGLEMQSPDTGPELIAVGIDLGLAYTRVSFSMINWAEPCLISNWPCRDLTRVSGRVPTAVTYQAGRRRMTAWGFECPPPSETRRGQTTVNRFIQYLDQDYLIAWAKNPDEEWADLAPTHDLREEQAALSGCGKETESIKLKQLEYRGGPLCSPFCPAMHVKRLYPNTQMAVDRLLSLVLVQQALEENTTRRLRLGHDESGPELDDTTEDMIKRIAQLMVYCEEELVLRRLTTIYGEPLPKGFSCAKAGINYGIMTFTGLINEFLPIDSDEIKGMFDKYINTLLSQINHQLESLEKIKLLHQITRFILKHHYDSAPYIRDRIFREFVETQSSQGKVGLEVINSKQAICRGLVINCLYSIPIRYHTSYGIRYKRRNKNKHPSWNTRLERNLVDNKECIPDQIFWLIRRGQPIWDDEPISQPFGCIVDLESQNTIACAYTIVSSEARLDCLPRSIHEAGVSRLC
ncbi:hypothetical protein AOQ84DRAFT_441199 [Glonium stellatum]|uniref:Uncharacterized protein n=1 Tax=Glonium stellatum TaxID=574774 RepID=A0A8E2JQI8_9PEZI|nr:hypothetical protein AOQ84DRAFT_441199 [Glonium stellatum]